MKKVIVLFFFSAFFFPLTAQSADKINEILFSEILTNEQAAYLIVSYQNDGFSDISFDEALSLLSDRDFFIGKTAAQGTMDLSSFSYICMKLYGIRGGLLYRWFPSGRYALRELKALNIIPGQADPFASISGREALRILSQLETDFSSTIPGDIIWSLSR